MRSLLIGSLSFTAWLGAMTIAGSRPAQAQTAADISVMATKSCAVMSGQAKPDSRTLQYLLMLNEDMADANPVAMALFHDVVHECPKAYLSYEQRLRAQNPFAAHPLVKQQTQLSNSGTNLTGPASRPDFPIRCRGARHGIVRGHNARRHVRKDRAPGGARIAARPVRVARSCNAPQ